MNKLFSKIIGASLAIAMMIGVGVGVNASKTAKPVDADSNTIVFATGSGDGTLLTTSATAESTVSSGTGCLTATPYSSIDRAYGSSSGGLKLGASSKAGSVTITLSESITPTSVVVNAKRYNSNKAATLNVNSVGAQSLTANYDDYTYAVTSNISNLVLASSNYCFVASVTINFTSGATTHKLTYSAGTHGTHDGTTTNEFNLVESTGTQTVKSPSDVGISGNTGYVFAKWNDGTADYLPGSTYTMGTADATLTAQWVAGVALSYDGNGATAGSTATTYVISGGTQTVANNGFTAPSGKEFKEWNTLSTGLGTSYNPGSEIENFTSPLTLYAIWKNISHVDFDATADRGATALTLTKSDITLTISDGTLSNGTDYRIYKGKTLTVSRSSGKMSSIIFTCTANGTSQYGPGCFTTASGYTYSGNTGTWEGAANSVTFTASSNQVRATKIVVNYYEGSDVTLDKTSLTLVVNGSSSTIAVSEIDGVTNPTYQWARVSGDDCVTLTNTNTNTVTVAPKGSAFAVCGLTLTVNGDNLEDPIVREASVYVARNSSAENPYTVVEAKKAVDLNDETYIAEAHVHGIVSTTPTLNSDNSLTYWISDDGTTGNQLQVFKGLKSDGTSFAYATDIEIAGQVTVKGTLKKYNSSTYEFDEGNRLVAYTAPVRVLSSIALSGTYPTQFLTGDAFSHAGMVVTATYDDDTQRNVTNYATFSGYNMAEAGTQEVTVSYEENDVTKTATYNITLTYVERTNYNLYQESEIAEGDYIFYYDGFSIKNTIVNGRASYETVQVVGNVISNYHTTNIWHIARNGEYYTIYNANVDKYLASTDSNNKAKLEDDVTDYSLWTATMSQAGTYEFVNKARDAANGNKYLRNNGDNGWACYSSSTGGELKLFRRDTMSYLDTFDTEAKLVANETDGNIDYVAIKYTTKIAKYAWDAIVDDYGISEFGMMVFGSRKETPLTVEEKFEAELDQNNPTTVRVVNADTYGLTLDEDGDYYSFTVKVVVSASNYDVKFCTAPYIVVNGTHHFLDNLTPSVNYLASNGLVESDLSPEALAALAG